MIIKNYHQPKGPTKPASDLQIIEDVTDVLVYAGCFNPSSIGDIGEAGVTTVYGSENQPANSLTRHIDFTRNGIRARLIVTDHAYICNDQGKTVEKVSC